MQQLSVYPFSLSNPDVHVVATGMDSLPRQPLAQVNWPAFSYKPAVTFAVAYDAQNLYVKFYVEEAVVRAANSTTHSPVYEDSCVEVFISFNEGATYYNLEFNCMGTALVGYGSQRENRKPLAVETVRQIKRYGTIMHKESENIHWTLTVQIPFFIFSFDAIASLAGRLCRANFYKCGDALPQPHFLSWNAINTAEPDFHQPPFFGQLRFER